MTLPLFRPSHRSHRATWIEDKTRILDKLAAPSAVAESKSAFDVESSPIDEIVKYLLSLGNHLPLLYGQNLLLSQDGSQLG